MYDEQRFWKIASLSVWLGVAGAIAPTLLLIVAAIIRAIDLLGFALLFFTLILEIIIGLVVGALFSALFSILSELLNSQRIIFYRWGQFVVPALSFVVNFFLQTVFVYPLMGITP